MQPPPAAAQEPPLLRARAAAAAPAAELALGRALALLLEADKREFQRATASLSVEHSAGSGSGGASRTPTASTCFARLRLACPPEALAAALLALRAQAARCTLPGAAAWAGYDPLLSPLLEAVVRSKAGSPKVWRVLDWLVALPGGGAAVAARLLAAAGDADKRARLGAALTVRHLCETSTQGQSPQLPPAAAALLAACAALVGTVQRDGTLHQGAPAPTRLTAASADAVLCASAALAAVAAAVDAAGAAEAGELLWQLTPSLEALAAAMAGWGVAAGRAKPLRALALAEIARHVGNVRAHGDAPGAQDTPAASATDADSDDEPQEEEQRSAIALPPRTVACRALAACWLHYAPLMLCEPADGSVAALSATAERWLSTLGSACAAGAQGDVSPRRAEAAQLHAVTCIGLLAAAAEAHPDGGAAALEAAGWVAAPRSLMEALRSPNERITTLAVASLRVVLLPAGGVHSALGGGQDGSSSQAGWSGRAQAALDALLPLLDERDGVSRAGVTLTGELIARQPGLSALRSIFEKLGASAVDTRRNALDVLSEALSRGAGQAPADAQQSNASAPHELLPEYAAALTSKILPCLSDADLVTRHTSALLLGRLSPPCVLPPLLALCGDRDGRTRSAAAEALAAVLRHHAPPARALSALLACIAASQQGTVAAASCLPAHPGQIGDARDVTAAAGGLAAPASGAALSDASVERALGILGKWAAADVAPADWPPLIDVLLHAMRAAPENASLVRAASALGSHMGAPGGPAAHVLRRVHALLAAQPAPATAQAGDAATLFERLSPLLVLRVLPLEAFDDQLAQDVLYGDLGGGAAAAEPQPDAVPAGATCIAVTLLRRMSDLREPDDVRRVAAELTGRLRPLVAWPWLLARLLDAHRASDMPHLRAALFAVCTALAARGTAALPNAAPPPRQLLAALTDVLTWALPEPDAAPHGAEELRKTQLGCMDFLAALVSAQLDASRGAGPRIAEVDADDAVDTCCADVLSPLLAVVICAADTLPWCAPDAVAEDALPSLRACCANAVITMGRHASSRARTVLAIRVLPTLARALSRGAVPPVARPAVFQVAFATAHHGGAATAPFAAELAELAAAALRSAGREHADTRLGAAKLLTALLGADEAVLSALAGSWQTVGDAVRGVAAMDASPELRAVCETLSRALGGVQT